MSPSLTRHQVGRRLIMGLIFAVAVGSVSLRTVRVSGVSMSPTFQDGQLLLGVKPCLWPLGIQRGNIIVFSDHRQLYIKRVIGRSGDSVQFIGNALFINGIRTDEPYVSRAGDSSGGDFAITIQPGHFFVMGDFRSRSRDSRSLGPVDAASISLVVINGY